MSKKMAIALLALSAFVVVPAFGIGVTKSPATSTVKQNTPRSSETCSAKVVGTYVNVSPPSVFLNGLPATLFVSQLTLHEDGTADSYSTAFLELPFNTGTASPLIGSWKCRDDGKLVLTVIYADYGALDPAIIAANPGLSPDITLANNLRQTFLFSVQNANTLNQVANRFRIYAPNEDPTNPNGGVLQPLDTTVQVYTRLEASDADLLLP